MSQWIDSRSRWLVGSSRSITSGPPEEHLGEEDAQLVAGGEGAHRLEVRSARDAEARRGARPPRSRPSSRRAPRRRPRARPRRTPTASSTSPARRRLLLRHRRPQLGLAGHDGVEDALLVVDEVVLLEDAELEAARRCRCCPASQSSCLASISSSVDLPAPLAPGDAVALARVELDRDVLEEDLRAEALGDLVEDESSGGARAFSTDFSARPSNRCSLERGESIRVARRDLLRQQPPRAPQAARRGRATRVVAPVDGGARAGDGGGGARARSRGFTPRRSLAGVRAALASRARRRPRLAGARRRGRGALRARLGPPARHRAARARAPRRSRASSRPTRETFVAIARRMALGDGQGPRQRRDARARRARHGAAHRPRRGRRAARPGHRVAARSGARVDCRAVDGVAPVAPPRRAPHRARGARGGAQGGATATTTACASSRPTPWRRPGAACSRIASRSSGATSPSRAGCSRPGSPALARGASRTRSRPRCRPPSGAARPRRSRRYAAVAPDAALALARRALAQGCSSATRAPRRRSSGACRAPPRPSPRRPRSCSTGSSSTRDADIGEAVRRAAGRARATSPLDRARRRARRSRCSRERAQGRRRRRRRGARAGGGARPRSARARRRAAARPDRARPRTRSRPTGAKEAYALARDALAAAQGSLFALEAVAPGGGRRRGARRLDRAAHVAGRAARPRRQPARARRARAPARCSAAARGARAARRGARPAARPAGRLDPRARGDAARAGETVGRARRAPAALAAPAARAAAPRRQRHGRRRRRPAARGAPAQALARASRAPWSTASSAIRRRPCGAPSSPRSRARSTRSSASGACDVVDALLVVARRVADPGGARDAGRGVDGSRPRPRARALRRASPSAVDGDAAGALPAFDELTRDIAPDASGRIEALRTALVRARRRARRHLVGRWRCATSRRRAGAEPEAVTSLESALASLAQLAVGRARPLRSGARVRRRPPPPPRARSRSPSPRVLSGAERALGEHVVAAALDELLAGVPEAIAKLVGAQVWRLAELPVDGSKPPSRREHARRPRRCPRGCRRAARSAASTSCGRSARAASARSSSSTRVEDKGDADAEKLALKVPEYSASAARALSRGRVPEDVPRGGERAHRAAAAPEPRALRDVRRRAASRSRSS